MTYPDFIVRFGNHSEDKYAGKEFDVEKLDRDLNVLYPTVNDMNRILRGITNADGSLAPADPDRENDIVDTQPLTGDGVTTVFNLINVIDSTVTLIGNILVDGVMLFETTDYTYDNTQITFVVAPALTTPDNITYQTFMNMAGVIDALKSVTFQEGGSLVGYADSQSVYNASTVSDALTEVRQVLDAHMVDFGAASQYLKADGSVQLTFDWAVNERKDTGTANPAIGSVTIISTVLDTTTISIQDGIIPGGVTFEFNLVATVPTPGNAKVLIGGTDDETIDNFVDAIGLSGLSVSAVNSGAGRADLTHQIASAVGNIPLTTSDAGIFTVVGMLNGTNGIQGDLCARFRIRNMPPSLQDGDAVVHEQLMGLLNVIESFSQLFIRIDGTSTMSGNLNMGGNLITNLGDGVEDTDGVNVGQLNTLGLDFDEFIPTLGVQHPTRVAQAQNLGSLTFSNAASDVASDPQDSGALVKTLSGVPLPGADHHVVNRLHVDNEVAVLQTQINALEGDAGAGGGDVPDGTVSVGSSLAGCDIDGVGFGTVPDINDGGIFNFESLTVVAAQTPTEDTYIFVDGDVTLTGNITMALKKLQISASGSITVDAACTLTCHDLVLRAGADINLDGAIVAHGNILKLTDFDLSVGGLVGFVSITAGGAVNQGAAATIDSAIINIQGGASSTMEGTIDAYIFNGESSGWSQSNPSNRTQGVHGPTFGKALGLRLGRITQPLIVNTVDSIGPIETSESRDLLTGFTYIPSRYAGGGGASAVIPGGAAGSGGAGGAGGTAGGNGGAGEFNTGAGLAADIKGSYRPYLYPLAPGGAGGLPDLNANNAMPEGGRAGGVINIYIVGDLVATGLSLVANGADGQINQNVAGGGGGGAIRAVCTGMMTDCTAAAGGGNAGNGTKKGGGGGGGGVHLIADNYDGAPLVSAAGGTTAGGGGSAAGQDGTATIVSMPAADIVCLAAEGYWRN